MEAIIMAGGSGTRLLPVTETMPKPLVKLCGKPVCCYILDLLSRHGCTKATFTLRYMGQMIEDHFPEKSYKGIKLEFSYEEKPLGTAGCVKKAAKNIKEPFIVISGDALCDFDLTSAMNFHKEKASLVTVITKSTSDPREYGLVTSKENEICGFIEKPSFTGCLDDKANTGVYIISPETLDFIDDEKFSDFASDIFPEILKSGRKMYSYEENGYWCDIGELTAYRKCQRDIIENKTGHAPNERKITVHGYCSSPCGEYSGMQPPFCIGENVSVGENTVIKNGSCIGDNVTVGRDCEISGAVLLEGCYIGDNVKLTDCILCEGVTVNDNSSICENAVIGKNAVVGKTVSVMPNVRIWQGKQTKDNVIISADIEKGSAVPFEMNDSGYSGETNITATPALMVKLGGAAAAASDKDLCIGYAKDERSKSFAECLRAGINAAGKNTVDCGALPLSALIYNSRLSGCGLSVHISAGVRTNIVILDGNGLPINRKTERIIEGIMNRGGAPRAHFDKFGKNSFCTDGTVFYRSMLMRAADFKSRYNISVISKDEMIKNICTPVFEKISDKNGKRAVVTVSPNGTMAEISFDGANILTNEMLLFIGFRQLMESGYDASVSYDTLFELEKYADNYNRRVYRYRSCSPDNSDSMARKLAAAEPFICDGCLLALGAFGYAAEKDISLDELKGSLPELNTEKRYVPTDRRKTIEIMRSLCDEGKPCCEGVMVSKSGTKVLIRSDKCGNGLMMFAESISTETAKELCDSIEKHISALNDAKRSKDEKAM